MSTLVAGVGNIFLGDDGFGVEVARRLALAPLPAGTRVRDFGIRGVHLAYELLEGYETLILVDTLMRGEAPGTLYVFEPDLDAPAPAPGLDGHGLNPAAVLALVKTLGGTVGRTLVVGCEPADMEERIGLSAQVALAVDEAVRLVRRLVQNSKEERP
jgi:hydrogenase maturation protease